MPRITTRDGLRLFVEDRGAGVPLLLVHGFTGSHEAWTPRLKTALASRFRLLCVDLLGHGRSSKPAAARRYALEEMVCDLCEVLDARKISRAIWVGYSMGGRIALGAAVYRPERMRALVLESASPGLSDAGARAERIAGDEKLALLLETEGIGPFVQHWMRQPLFRTQQCLGAEHLDEERARRIRNAPHALAACLRGLGSGVQPSLWNALPALAPPTLLLVGELDAKFRDIAARMRAVLPSADLETLPGVGHATHLECTPRYLDTLRRFSMRLKQERGEDKHEGPLENRR